MTYLIDVVALLLLVLNIFLGWKLGIVNRAIVFAGLYGGVAAATFAGNAIESWAHGTGNPTDLYANAWTYLAIVGVVLVMVEILAALYHERVRMVTSLAFDRTAGAIGGVVLAVLQVSIICLVAEAVGDASQTTGRTLPPDRANVSSAVRDGVIGKPIDRLLPGVERLFSPALPSDLSGHLASAAETTETKNQNK